ncbi:MAG: TetR/AcrR family transcriptional regulator, partial [Eggerthellaceae bacterium]|nr:TetR/AcrR family transcriptional regulator [Eggerthellaceae bacterium]
MKSDGVEALSIRNVSAKAGYSSATLYLYFEDLNELISLSSVFYLRNYVQEIVETGGNEQRSPKETYRYTWDVFARHAFNKPEIYLNLFYGPNSDSLDEMVREYYKLFPNELEHVRAPLLGMLEAGNLLDRNKAVLKLLAEDLGMSEHDIDLANKMTIAYFRTFRERAAQMEMTEETHRQLTDEFIEAAFFVLHD